MSLAAAIDPLAATTVVVAVVDPQLRQSVVEAIGKTSVRVIDETYSSGDIEELAASIERLRPSVLFLGLPGLAGDAAAAVARIASLEFAPRVVAISGSPNPEVILKAIRAGAAEFLYPPFEPDFEAVLRGVVSAPHTLAEPPATGKVIGFSSVKGGCGATTLACHVASWLRATAKKEVLLADLDLSSGIIAGLMQGAAKYTLDDALQNLHRLDLKLWKALVTVSQCGVDVIPAPAEPQTVVPISRKLPPMLRFWRTHYEFAMVDLGHGITSPLLDTLASLDTLVLVATNEVPALRQARQMIQYLAVRDFGGNRVKLVLNRMPKRPSIELPELERIMGLPIHSVLPNDYQILNEAYSHPKLIDLNSTLGIQFGNFAAKLAGISTPKKEARRLFAFR